MGVYASTTQFMAPSLSVSLVCPHCGSSIPGHGGLRFLPTGRALILLGGLTLIAAYFMPWFTISNPQGSLSLTGEFLGRFLGSSRDLRQFVPGSSGDPSESQALRALVHLFPTSGAVVVLLASLGAFKRGFRLPLNVTLAVLGLVPLAAVLVGMSRLPATASPQTGLWLIGAGAVTIIVGAGLDSLLAQRAVQK